MSNTRLIQPKNLWTPSGEKQATILAIYNFFDYHFDGGGGKISYKLVGMESPAEGFPESAVDYFEGTIDIPSYIIQQWGESDEIIWNYVSTTLNLIFI